MSWVKLELIRDDIEGSLHNFGKMYFDGEYLGETLEDPDREGEAKVDGDTAIPRGVYKIIVSRSVRFNKRMPEVLNVPNFTGIRIHGGNTEAQTLGCPLLGLSRTPTGIRNCAPPNTRLIELLEAEAAAGRDVYLEVL